MKRVKVKSSSVPALVIGLVTALGLGTYAYIGSGGSKIDFLPGNDQFYLPQVSGQAPSLAQAVPAAVHGSTALGSVNMARWIKPALAVLFTEETRVEPSARPFVQGVDGATYLKPGKVQVTRKLGTGVVVHPSGYILTNNHLVEAADSLLVKIDGVPDPMKASVIDVDPRSDLCLLKVHTNYPLTVASVHQPNHIQPGEQLIAVSVNPDMTSEAHRATVSGIHRTVQINGAAHGDLITLDKALDASFAGAPLVDQNGFVAGLVLPLDHNNGRGMGAFAISTKTIQRFLSRSMERMEAPVLIGGPPHSFAMPPAQAIQAGLVREAPLRTESNSRFWLGINFQNLEPAQAKMYGSPFPKGAMVNFIHPQGPAAASGVQAGDIVLKANGRFVRGGDDIDAVVRRAKGGPVTLQIFRKGKRIEIKAPTAESPIFGTPGMNRAGMGINVARQTVVPAQGAEGFNNMANAPAPRIDLDRMMEDQRKRMIIERAGLDPSLMNTRLDNDLIMRMARDRLIAIRLGIDPGLMAGRGANRTMIIRKTLWNDLAPRLGVDPSMVNLPGVTIEQLIQLAETRALAESLGVGDVIATAPGTATKEDIVRMAVNNYIAGRLGVPVEELNAMKAPPGANTAQTAVQPGQAAQGAVDMDRMMRQRRIEYIVSKLDLDPNLLSVPGMSQERLLKIAGDRFLAAQLGVNPASLDMPGFDRDRIIRMAVIRQLAQKLGVPAQLAAQRQASSEQIVRIAENRLLAERLGLSTGVAAIAGMSRERLLRIAGDRMLASVLGAGAN